MAKLTKNILSIDYDRRCLIIERAKNVSIMLHNYLVSKDIYNNMGLNYKLEKAYAFYKKTYDHEYLTEDELTIFYLYVVFPNDKDFVKLIDDHHSSYTTIAKLYNVTESFIKLRYVSYINMKRYKKDVKTLELKNNNSD